MDTVILDVVIGLVLAYLVLALLVTKVQEMLVGQLGTSRKHTMHDMLDEALQRDAGLKIALLQNPLISALYKGTDSSKGTLRANGPSAIPSDLFARVLLVEVFKDGKNNHPKEKFETPLLFVQSLDASTRTANEKVLGVLRALVAGHEKSWPEYEAAIAEWFDQVGERANGWFQRKTLLWGLGVSLLLAAVLNVNTFQLAQRLAGDPDLRRSFVALAQRTVDEFGSGNTQQNAALPVQAPATRVDQALEAASNQLVDLFFKHSKFAGFDPNREELALNVENQLRTPIQACALAGVPVPAELQTNGKKAVAGADTEASKKKSLLSNPEAWMQLLPPLRKEVKSLRLPDSFEVQGAAQAGSAASAAEAAASQPTVTECKPAKGKQCGPKLGSRDDRLRTAHACVSGLVGWVGMAVGAKPEDAALVSGLRLVSKSLNEASDALQEMIEGAGSNLLVNQLYRRDPEAFDACAHLPGMTRARLRSCVDSAMTGQISLPIGWTGRNVRETFCEVVKVPKGAVAPAPGCWGSAEPFNGHDGLGISGLVLTGPTFAHYFFAFLGLLVTALFAALGAPFWFDLLGRFVKMRAAGTPPQTQDQKATPPGAGAGGAGGGASPSGGPEPFSDARNDFERQLTIADKMALQTALHVTATGVLDEATRRALVPRARELGVELANTDELSLLAFLKITNKMPAALAQFDSRNGTDAAKQAQGDLVVHIDALAQKLHDAFDFKSRQVKERDEQRAFAMLWLVRNQSSSGVPSLAELSTLARDTRIGRNMQDWPAEVAAPLLALTADKLSPGNLKRADAKWLDWALGELGQTQASKDRREESNPRVVAYLEAAGFAQHGDNTDWCGAFLAWVVNQYNDDLHGTVSPKLLPVPPASAGRAQAWGDWGDERKGDPEQGDVVVLYRDRFKDSFHAAIVVKVNPDRSFLVVGGNQDEPGCVSLRTCGLDSVHRFRKPETPATSPAPGPTPAAGPTP